MTVAGKTILLVTADQLSAKWLEQCFAGVAPAPNLAALAARGRVYSRAFTNNPVCSPARANMLTGMSPSAHGLAECGYRLDESVPTVMRCLQSAGWRTGLFGKLHFWPQWETLFPDYSVYGFDVVHNTEDPRAGEWLDWVRLTHPEHYEAALATVWMTQVPEIDDPDETGHRLADDIARAKQRHPETNPWIYELPFPPHVSQAAWITDRATDFLRDESPERDLFLHVSYVEPHNPFAPPEELLARVDTGLIPEPVGAEWKDDGPGYFRQRFYQDGRAETDIDWRRNRANYFASISFLDEQIGRLVAAVAAARPDGETSLVFTSDHGELLHDHGLSGKWERHYDACIRVPLIVVGPGGPAGAVDDLVDHYDIAPTILSWAGVPEPTLPTRAQDASGASSSTGTRALRGRSLDGSAPASSSSGAPASRRFVYVESNGNDHIQGLGAWARTVRTDRYRYSLFMDGGGEQLFDLIDDPDEQVNLAERQDPDAQRIRRELRDLLLEAVILDGYPPSPRGLYRLGTW
jgi:choline-sulfatase